MNKLTVEGLVKILKKVSNEVSLDHFELFADGSGSLENTYGNASLAWDNLEEMFEELSELSLSDVNHQTKLADKFN